MPLPVGSAAPPFSLRNQHRQRVSLEDLKGSPSVIVFIPLAFTSTCQSELCTIRDNLHQFNQANTRVVAITCNTLHSNNAWAEQQGFTFDILSDFWPHGETAKAYDNFNEIAGTANRTTYFLDKNGIITAVVASDEPGVARAHEEYEAVLAAL